MEAWEECDCGEDGDCRCCHPFDSLDDKGCQLRKDAECRLVPTVRARRSDFAKCETLPTDKIRPANLAIFCRQSNQAVGSALLFEIRIMNTNEEGAGATLERHMHRLKTKRVH